MLDLKQNATGGQVTSAEAFAPMDTSMPGDEPGIEELVSVTVASNPDTKPVFFLPLPNGQDSSRQPDQAVQDSLDCSQSEDTPAERGLIQTPIEYWESVPSMPEEKIVYSVTEMQLEQLADEIPLECKLSKRRGHEQNSYVIIFRTSIDVMPTKSWRMIQKFLISKFPEQKKIVISFRYSKLSLSLLYLIKCFLAGTDVLSLKMIEYDNERYFYGCPLCTDERMLKNKKSYNVSEMDKLETTCRKHYQIKHQLAGHPSCNTGYAKRIRPTKEVVRDTIEAALIIAAAQRANREIE